MMTIFTADRSPTMGACTQFYRKDDRVLISKHPFAMSTCKSPRATRYLSGIFGGGIGVISVDGSHEAGGRPGPGVADRHPAHGRPRRRRGVEPLTWMSPAARSKSIEGPRPSLRTFLSSKCEGNNNFCLVNDTERKNSFMKKMLHVKVCARCPYTSLVLRKVEPILK